MNEDFENLKFHFSETEKKCDELNEVLKNTQEEATKLKLELEEKEKEQESQMVCN